VTPEQQRIAVAKACGWTYVTSDLIGRPPWSDRCGADDCAIPDYLNDLNAIREAILSLPTADISGKDQVSVHRHLGYVCKDPHHMRTWLASPAELTEAFLRALGLREE
jgi:hypothetical protein